METFLILFQWFDPTSLGFPAINPAGTIQAIELMIASDGAMGLFPGESGTHIHGDITVDGNTANTNLQDQQSTTS